MSMTDGRALDADLARRWLRSVVPSWIYRYLMPALWVAAIAASFASDDQPCSVADPTVCGPDATFSVAMVVCFGSLVMWWWLPRLAALFGTLFALLDLQYDDVAGARVAWTGYASACLVVLAALTVSRRRQRALTAGLRRIPVTLRAATPRAFTFPLLGVAGVLVIVGVAALGVMRWQEQRENVHLGRATSQTAVVEAVDDQGDLKLRLSDGSRRTVTPLDQYAVGADIQVLLDPADPHWVRLPAEMADYTPWYTVAGGAWVLALLLVARETRHRRALPRRSWTAPGLPVRIAPDSSSAFAIQPVDGSDRVVGFLMVDLDDEEADGRLLAAFDALGEEAEQMPRTARKEWEKVLRRYEGEAVLVGELVEGEWPTVVLGDTVMRPSGPFRAPRQKPWAIFGRRGFEERDGLPVRAAADDRAEDEPVVEAASDIPTLPWRLPLEQVPWWSRVLLVGPFVVVPVLIWSLWSEPLDWWGALTASLIGFSVLRFTAARVFYRVVVSADDVRIRTGVFKESVSWQDVTVVDVGENSVVLGTGEDWLEIGGIAEGRAAEVAALLEALRLRARYGVPASPSRRRLGPSVPILVAYLVVCGALLVTLRWGV